MPSRSATPPHNEIQYWAEPLARQQLQSLPSRWHHTRSVAAQARIASVTIGPQDRALLEAAAWLHDIGYGPKIADTGFHPLDGARYLAGRGAPARLINLVANHSCARFEADERGMLPELQSYELEVGPVADALIWADMTTGPTGQTVTVEDRLAEILRRYTEESPVHRAIEEASGDIVAAVRRVQIRLTG
ncbi:HD domain-containing protein [Nakamurella sp. UYEF19]|uniref:HD domain-containing protein n=1 Tax=Nakamurella sp. UYEF19 TaxID=1756392 RepID=UPI003398E281